MRMLDLFCGRWGWSRAFAARGWECVGVDLVDSAAAPDRCVAANSVWPICRFLKLDVLDLQADWIKNWAFDFICASSPCEEFSVHGMKHFHPNPKYPSIGIQLFEHTRRICEESGVPYVMENVRAAQNFVGPAANHCGPFYLWGTGVPPLMPQGISKGMTRLAMGQREHKGKPGWNTKNENVSRRLNASGCASVAATIPPELANCVADYAERICRQEVCA